MQKAKQRTSIPCQGHAAATAMLASTSSVSLVLTAHALRKVFPSPVGELIVLDDVELEVRAGELVAIVGDSGVGKSTLLYLLAALDLPTAGSIAFQGKALQQLSATELAAYRNHCVGFVWQLHNLLLDFTAAENVMLPLLVRGESAAKAYPQAAHWLAEVGLSARMQHLAGELSAGEQQRVALARALVTQPQLLLADEPTGNLDASNAEVIFTLLTSLHRRHGLTSVIATHNVVLAGRCDCVWRLAQGKLQRVSRPPQA